MKVANMAFRFFITLLLPLFLSVTIRADIAHASPIDDYALVFELKNDDGPIVCGFIFTTFTGEELVSLNCANGNGSIDVEVTENTLDVLLDPNNMKRSFLISPADLHTASHTFAAHDNNPSNDAPTYAMISAVLGTIFSPVTFDRFSPQPRVNQLIFRPGEAPSGFIRVGGWKKLIQKIFGRKATKEVAEKARKVNPPMVLAGAGCSKGHTTRVYYNKVDERYSGEICFDEPPPGMGGIWRKEKFTNLTAVQFDDRLQKLGLNLTKEFD